MDVRRRSSLSEVTYSLFTGRRTSNPNPVLSYLGADLEKVANNANAKFQFFLSIFCKKYAIKYRGYFLFPHILGHFDNLFTFVKRLIERKLHVVDKSRSEQAPGSAFHPCDESTNIDWGLLGPC